MSLQTSPERDVASVEALAGRFPDTRYMGSKRKLLPAIGQVLDQLELDSALDAFSGSACVAYLMKSRGLRVTANDFLKFSYQIAHATIENEVEHLTEQDVEMLLEDNPDRDNFIQRNFAGLYYSDEDNLFLDNLWANLDRLENSYKRSLALASAHRACLKRRPRGIFTYVGFRYDDGRADLKKSLRDHFLTAVELWNDAVLSTGLKHEARGEDVFSLDVGHHDLVYIDPPYLSPMSDNEYTRRYHFIEGLASYWHEAEIQWHTKTKKIKRRETPFGSKDTVHAAFDRVFERFSDSMLLVSYSSTGIPNRDELVEMLNKFKKRVQVFEYDHTYSFGTHGHKIGNGNNRVLEYLFLAT